MSERRTTKRKSEKEIKKHKELSLSLFVSLFVAYAYERVRSENSHSL